MKASLSRRDQSAARQTDRQLEYRRAIYRFKSQCLVVCIVFYVEKLLFVVKHR